MLILKLKYYLIKNKQIIFVYIGLGLVLLVSSISYCIPGILLPAITYFSGIGPEFWASKIIDKVFEFSPFIINKTVEYSPYAIYSTGGLVLGTLGVLGGIKVTEYGYNWRFFANQYAQSTPILGSVLKGTNSAYKWWTKKELTNVDYSYFYPKIATAFGYSDLFDSKLVVDLSNLHATLNREVFFKQRKETVERIVEVPVDNRVVEFVERTVVQEKPVYVTRVEYKDRENLVSLEDQTIQLTNVGHDLLFLQNKSNSRDDIIKEILSLSEHENAVCLKLGELQKNYYSFDMGSVTEDYAFSFSPMKIKHISFDSYYNKFKFVFGEVGATVHVSLLPEVFKERYPCVHKTFMYILEHNAKPHEMLPIIKLKYLEQHSFFGSSFSLNAPACVFEYPNDGEQINLLKKIEEVLIGSLQVTTNDFNVLASNIKEKVLNEQRLINIESRDQSAQTMEFSLNDMLFDRINSYLDIRDETSFTVASNNGNNLPFDTMTDKTIPTKIKESSVKKTQESLIQTDSSENIETLDINSAVSAVVQNPAMMFAATLGILAADNLHTIEAAVQILLDFTTFPAYNDAFVTATHMGIEELQNTYNLTYHAAVKAQDLLGAAYDVAYPETSMSEISSRLSDSNDDIPKSFSWNKYLLVGTSIVILASTSYILWQSLKTGATPVDQAVNTIQNITPNVEIWKNNILNEIDKL